MTMLGRDQVRRSMIGGSVNEIGGNLEGILEATMSRIVESAVR